MSIFGDYSSAHQQGMNFRQAGATQGLRQNQQPGQGPRGQQGGNPQALAPYGGISPGLQGLLAQFPSFRPMQPATFRPAGQTPTQQALIARFQPAQTKPEGGVPSGWRGTRPQVGIGDFEQRQIDAVKQRLGVAAQPNRVSIFGNWRPQA